MGEQIKQNNYLSLAM